MPARILTVTEVTDRIKTTLESAFSDLWLEGEISNLSVPQSGHAYFTLKDEQSQIRAVLFRSSQRFLKFTLQHGLQVICRGRLSVYEPRGEYQLILEYIEPKGVGALQLAFEQLKAKLEREGLFEPGRKKQLPLLPRRIGIVTSPTGAAIRDILRVIRRRHPRMHILIYPVPVQGPEAAPAIVEALAYFNRERNVDVIIAARGGGSLEDLWAFNEEMVARALFRSRLPVISAVGHETDFTIADFVADLRSPTPSAAAEIVVRSEQHFCTVLAGLESALVRILRQKIERARASVREGRRLLSDPRRILERQSQRIGELSGRLANGLLQHIRRDRSRLAALASGLDHLNPLAILSRGYSITKKIPGDRIMKDAADLHPGDMIRTRLFRGEILSRIEAGDRQDGQE